MISEFNIGLILCRISIFLRFILVDFLKAGTTYSISHIFLNSVPSNDFIMDSVLKCILAANSEKSFHFRCASRAVTKPIIRELFDTLNSFVCYHLVSLYELIYNLVIRRS